VRRVRDLIRGAEDKFFAAAALSPEDEAWWRDCGARVAAGMEWAAEVAALDDAGVERSARERWPGMFEAADRAFDGRAERARLVEQVRSGSDGWKMAVAGLLTGAERILLESLRMPRRAGDARAALLGFAGAVAVQSGAYDAGIQHEGGEG